MVWNGCMIKVLLIAWGLVIRGGCAFLSSVIPDDPDMMETAMSVPFWFSEE